MVSTKTPPAQNDVPKLGSDPAIRLRLADYPKDVGHLVESFEFRGMMNGGYIVRFKLYDSYHNVINDLASSYYFRKARNEGFPFEFQISWNAKFDEEFSTKVQTAYGTALRCYGDAADMNTIEMVGVDPASWYLSAGDAAGWIWKGKVSNVIKQVIEYYGLLLKPTVSETTDSDDNYWPQNRLDPKTFIASLLDWSSSITRNKTNWVISPDKYDIYIREQSSIKSVSRAIYQLAATKAHDSILGWEVLMDNGLSIMNTKLVTNGMSATTGQYFDRITDPQEQIVFAKDSRTSNKLKASIFTNEGFAKPDDGEGTKPPDTDAPGWTSIPSIPEFNGGEIGIPYRQYIDGRARTSFLNTNNLLMRIKLKVPGHRIWDSCLGLGTDTVYLDWRPAKTGSGDDVDAKKALYFLGGHWIVYGFHHVFRRDDTWNTYVYLARLDEDAAAKRVPQFSLI